MAGVLETLAVNLRSKLAASPASLTALPENVSINDVPDMDKTVFEVVVLDDDRVGAEHGGGSLVEHFGRLAVRIVWFDDDDEEAASGTRADDLQNVSTVMDKVSNWTSGVILVSRDGSSSQKNGTVYRAELTYTVRYRASQDLT